MEGCYVFEWALQQVLNNLLDNALKYSPPGALVMIHIGETEDRKLRIAVRDQGKGIAGEDLERIFEEPFYRGALKEANPAAGVGIGLNLARRYVQEQGGRLWAESKGLGQGSVFYVLLPLEFADCPRNTSVSDSFG